MGPLIDAWFVLVVSMASWLNREQSKAPAIRGGKWSDGAGPGVFALSVDRGPSASETYLGLRCARRQ